jgi:putative hydrolase of the HAD superfamily
MTARALLVDYGGVLTTSVIESFGGYCRQHGVSADAISRVFEDVEAVADIHALEVGRLATADFEARFAAHLGVAAADLVSGLFAGCLPDEEMLAAVGAARAAGVPTGLVSNSWGLAMYDRARIDPLFDAIVISGEVGLRKPEAAIFDLAAERLGVPLAESVFVDDLPWNCLAAEELGMRAVRHRRATDTIAELERLLGVPLRDASR